MRAYVWDDDVGAGLENYNQVCDRHVGESRLEFVTMEFVDPDDFIDDTCFFDGKRKGWLLSYPKEEWEKIMHDEVGRDFSKTINMWKHGEMRAGISIDDELGDGRGRAIFFHAIGEKMPVAYYKIKPKKRSNKMDAVLAAKNDQRRV